MREMREVRKYIRNAPFLFALALLTLTSFSGFVFSRNSASVHAAPDLSAKLLPAASPAISAERIANDIQYLASDELQGRRAGTEGAKKAADFIAENFRKDGLTPAVSGGSFFQPFSFVSKVELGKDNQLAVTTDGKPSQLKVKDDWMPLAFSTPQAVSGEVVFAGYGISAPELKYDNYAGLNCAGKVALIIRGGPDGDNPHGRFADYTMPGREVEFKTLKAREKGAAAVIFVSTMESFSQDSISRLPFDLNFLDGRIAAAAISYQKAKEIFLSAGLSFDEVRAKLNSDATAPSFSEVKVDLKAEVEKISSDSTNVIGLIPGSDSQLKSQYIIIGAHYDHLGLGGPESLDSNPYGKIHHGADDNASGTAALLELARVLSADRSKLKRSILFTSFSGEEEGLLGSGAYVKNPPIPLSSTVAMINMDMVGRLRDNNLIIGGVGTSPEWKPLLAELNKIGEGDAGTAPGPATTFNMVLQDDGYGPSDHQSFYVHDIPVLFFFTGSHPDYHKPTDTADKINNSGAAQVAELVREITVRLANEPERVAFSKVKGETKPTSGGFRVYLGTIPNYSEQVEGLKLDGVRPGSPAEKAGLKAGDVVVKLGKVQVKNIYDYTYALEDLRGGQEVEIQVMRGGKLLNLKITPEKRN